MDSESDKEESLNIDLKAMKKHTPTNHSSPQRKDQTGSGNDMNHNGYSAFEKEFLQFSKCNSANFETNSSRGCHGNKNHAVTKIWQLKPHRKSPYTTLSGMVLKKYRKQRKNMLAGLRKNVRFMFSNENGCNAHAGFKSSHTQSIKDLSTNNCVLDSADHVCSDLSMSEMGSELSGNRGNGYSPFNSSNSCGSPECNVNSTSDHRPSVRNHTDISSVDSQDDSQDEESPKHSCIPEQNNNAETAQDCSCQKPSSPKSQDSSDTEDYIDVVSLEGNSSIVDIEMVLDQQVNSQQSKSHDTKKQLSLDIAKANEVLSSDDCLNLPNSSHPSSSRNKTPVSAVKWQQQFMSFISTSASPDQTEVCKSPSHSGRKKRSRRVRHSVCACCLGGTPSHGKRKRHHSEGDLTYSRRRHSVSGNHKRFIRDMVQLVSLRNKIMKLFRILFPNNLKMECGMNCDTERVDELIDDVIDILRSPDYDLKKEPKSNFCEERCDTRDKSRDSPDNLDCPPLMSLDNSSLNDDQNDERDDDEMPVLSMFDYKSENSSRAEENRPPDKENIETRVYNDLQACQKSTEKNDFLPQNGPPDDLTELDNVLHRFLSQVDSPENKDKSEIGEDTQVTMTSTADVSNLQICSDSEQNRKISEADSVLESASGTGNSLCIPEEHQRTVSEADSVIHYDQNGDIGLLSEDHIRTVSEADSGIGYDPDITPQHNDSLKKSISHVDDLTLLDMKINCMNGQIISKSTEENEQSTLDKEANLVADSYVDNNVDKCETLVDDRLMNTDNISEQLLSEFKHTESFDNDRKQFLLSSTTSDITSPLMVRTDDPFLNNDKCCPGTPLNKSAISLSESATCTPLDRLKVKGDSIMDHFGDGFELANHDIDQSNEPYYPTICHEMASSLLIENSGVNPKLIEVYDVGIVLCKKPKVCLKAFKKRLYILLRWLLPHLQFRNYFFKSIDNLEFLLDTLISCNDPNKLVGESKPVQV